MIFTPVFATDDSIFGGIEITPELKETNRNAYYCFIGGRLITSFPTALIQDEFGEREIILYPPEYAGCYIDTFNNLHIVLTKNADYETTKRNYQEIMRTNDEEIIYDIADFPLSYLYKIQGVLSEVMPNFDISAISVDEITNRVAINIDRAREKDTLEFLKSKFDDFDEKSILFDDPAEFRFVVDSSASGVLEGSNNNYSEGIFGIGNVAIMICIIVVALVLIVGLIVASLCLYFSKRGKILVSSENIAC